MYIKSFRVRNYKSFEDSGHHTLTPGFNVILGQNNSGKTALIEALNHFPHGAKPHNNSNFRRTSPREKRSFLNIEFEASPDELHNALIAANGCWFPIPRAVANASKAPEFVKNYLSKDRNVNVNIDDQQNRTAQYPSNQMFQRNDDNSRYAVHIKRDISFQDIETGDISGSGDDNF
tara:strand:- start:3997 stop:4524 length:528 start_codon:yes stop_codon:yes gene_type:complete